jgi:hypothetical protein
MTGRRAPRELVAALGADRVWISDAEAVWEQARFYAGALPSLAAISRGSFAPVAVSESWHRSDPEPPVIELAYELDGRDHRFWILRRGDFATTELLLGVNRSLAPDAPRFEIAAPVDQDWHVVCVGAGERRALLADGFAFAAVAADAAWRHLQGAGWLRRAEPTRSLAELDALVADDPADPLVRYQRGLLRELAGDADGAQEDWAHAANLGMHDVYQRLRDRRR